MSEFKSQPPAINREKLDFMLSYFIAARSAGRSADCGDPHARREITTAASDLYDKAHAACRQ